MKEYKYKINGNVYKVAIGDIEDNIAHVEVNGTPYKVEMEKAPKAVVKPVYLQRRLLLPQQLSNRLLLLPANPVLNLRFRVLFLISK